MRSHVGGQFEYELFGLSIRSEIELPELRRSEDAREVDVVIRWGSLDKGPVEGDVRADRQCLVLSIPRVAYYRVQAGREITVAPDRDVPERNLRLFLLGSAFGVLLHQRGMLPLHANAVEIGGRAVAFMGASGSGKSTLAAWFHDRGYKVLADDVCAIGFGDDGVAKVRRGLPRLR
ncbi:MAG: hypothetical protein JOY77_14110, partial [Alphaproteobacteria bacterium]|nr:hypothetical protein [Alphaproteobacteria bacterium]